MLFAIERCRRVIVGVPFSCDRKSCPLVGLALDKMGIHNGRLQIDTRVYVVHGIVLFRRLSRNHSLPIPPFQRQG